MKLLMRRWGDRERGQRAQGTQARAESTGRGALA